MPDGIVAVVLTRIRLEYTGTSAHLVLTAPQDLLNLLTVTQAITASSMEGMNVYFGRNIYWLRFSLGQALFVFLPPTPLSQNTISSFFHYQVIQMVATS